MTILRKLSAGAPISNGHGVPSREFQSLFNDLIDDHNTTAGTADAAVPKTTEVIAGGGLHVGGTLDGNVGITLYRVKTSVAMLPASGNAQGDWAYATDGRKTGEGGGAGTGVPVWYSNGAWYAVCSGAIVTA